jgi:hypothetical protein
MASNPRNKFLQKILSNLNRTKDLHAVKATGPDFLTNMIDNEQNLTIKELSKSEVYIVEWTQRDLIEKCKLDLEECAKQYTGLLFSFWTGSWLSPSFESD